MVRKIAAYSHQQYYDNKHHHHSLNGHSRKDSTAASATRATHLCQTALFAALILQCFFLSFCGFYVVQYHHTQQHQQQTFFGGSAAVSAALSAVGGGLRLVGDGGSSSNNNNQQQLLLQKQKQQQQQQQHVRHMYEEQSPLSSSNETQQQKYQHLHPLAGMIQHHTTGYHDPTQRRRCFTFTAVPKELGSLSKAILDILNYERYSSILDCIHVNIPHRALRFSTEQYPTTAELMIMVGADVNPKIILNRLPDYGPMTRYIGPLAYERHPQTSLVLFDIDSHQMLTNPKRDLVVLFFAAQTVDPNAVWCFQGEDFLLNAEKTRVTSVWDTFESQHWNTTLQIKNNINIYPDPPAIEDPSAATAALVELEWNPCHFCRGVGGLLFQPQHFVEFWYNQSDYHESCFWDDDRWVSYQFDRQGFDLKVIHASITVTPTTTPETPLDKISAASSEFLDLKWLLRAQPIVRSEKGEEQNSTNQRRQRRRLSYLSTKTTNTTTKTTTTSTETVATSTLAMTMMTNTMNKNKTNIQLTQQRHRRLGSLTAITKKLKSDQTCPLAWMITHPESYPTARYEWYEEHILRVKQQQNPTIKYPNLFPEAHGRARFTFVGDMRQKILDRRNMHRPEDHHERE